MESEDDGVKVTKESVDKDIENRMETSEAEDSDSMEESENVNVEHKVECKDENIRNGIKTSPNKNSNTKNSKNSHRIKSNDEDIIVDEYCSEATYLARQMASAERLRQAESMVIKS